MFGKALPCGKGKQDHAKLFIVKELASEYSIFWDGLVCQKVLNERIAGHRSLLLFYRNQDDRAHIVPVTAKQVFEFQHARPRLFMAKHIE